MFYDVFGQGIIRAFDSTAFGLSSSLTNPSGQLTALTAPRFTGVFSVPSQLVRPAAPVKFPILHPTSGAGSFAITNSVDDRIQAPYSMALNFSVGREFGGGLYVQGSYVGRLSRRSLVSRDLAMPTDLKDPQSGQTYFEAATAMANLVNARTPIANVPRVPFWEYFFPNLAAGGRTASQTVFQSFGFYPNDWSSALADLDQFDDPACGSRLGCNSMFSSQYSALGALSSIAGGNYHSMQWTARKRFGSGLLLDANYTFAKSIDLSSDSENAQGPNGPSTVGFAGLVVNPWNPGQRKGVSDYDMRHIFNMFAVAELPFGKNKKYLSGSGGLLNALIGGWQVAPTLQASSGLPASVGNGRNWPTNWNITGWATPTSALRSPSGAFKNAPSVTGAAGPNIFSNPSAALGGFTFTLPGRTGSRNIVRGHGPFAINLGVGKRFVMPWSERQSVQFRWETFNLTNTTRFDVNSLTLNLGNTGNFGKYSDILGDPREMQFALRFEF
jgi:hypothetical protein